MAGLAPAMDRACLTIYVGPPRGGCYDRLRRLVAALAARGWTVHFVGPEPPAGHTPALSFHAVPGPASGSPSMGLLLKASRQAAAIVRGQRIPLVFTFGAVYSAPLAPLLVGSGARLVTFLRGSLLEQERARGSGALRRMVARACERLALAASDRVVAVSQALARPAASKAEVLPNEAAAPAAALDAAAARRALGLPEAAFIAAYAGAITPIKSLETLIEAARPLPGVHVALLGFSREGSPYEAGLRAQAAALDGRAHLLEWRPDARALVAAADVVVLPSRDEGSPNLLLEAMAAGRPCLGARCSGVEEMLREDALLFPPGDAAALRARLARLVEDAGARAEAAALCAARAGDYRFDWDERAASVLERVLADPR